MSTSQQNSATTAENWRCFIFKDMAIFQGLLMACANYVVIKVHTAHKAHINSKKRKEIM